MQNEILKNISQTLDRIGYIFPKSMSEIRTSSCDFLVEKSRGALSLPEFFIKESHLAN